MTGNDDHGVKDATLHVTMGNEKLVSKNMLEGRPPQPEFKAIETLDLAKLRVKPGAKLNYWLTVRDNKEPSSNQIRDRAPAHRGHRAGLPGRQEKAGRQPEKQPGTGRAHGGHTADEESATDKAAAIRTRQDGDENPGTARADRQEDESKAAERRTTGISRGPAAPTRRTQTANGRRRRITISPSSRPKISGWRTSSKSLLNKQERRPIPPAISTNPADAQPKNANSPPGNQGTPAHVAEQRQFQAAEPRDSGGARPNNSQRPAAEESRSVEVAQTAPSQPGDANSNDPSNQVQRAERNGNQRPERGRADAEQRPRHEYQSCRGRRSGQIERRQEQPTRYGCRG